MNTEYQNNFNELIQYLNLKVSDSVLDGENIKNMNPNEELFTLKVTELLNAGYTSFIRTIKMNVDNYIKKTNLNRGFLLNTINGEMLNYPIEELIKILKEAKKILESQGAKYRNFALDANSDAGKYASEIMAFPTTILVDRKGNVVGEPMVGGIDNQDNYDALMKQIQSVIDADSTNK